MQESPRRRVEALAHRRRCGSGIGVRTSKRRQADRLGCADMHGPEIARHDPAPGVAHYDSRSDRPFTSSLSRRTISAVLRISASPRATPMVEAIVRNRAFSSS
jgi:hypothetical protein